MSNKILSNAKKLSLVLAVIFAAHIGFWHWIIESVFGFSKDPKDQQDKARFSNGWGWLGGTPGMDQAWLDYDGTFDMKKNLMSEYVRANAQMVGKFGSWLLVMAVSIVLIVAICVVVFKVIDLTH